MFKKIATITLLSSLSAVSSAEWLAGADYSKVDIEEISLNSFVATIGYKFNIESSNFSLIPELGLGFGVGDDSLEFSDGEVIKYELDQSLTLSLKGQFDVNESTYVFLKLGRADVDTDVKFDRASESLSGDGFGFGLGVGLQFNDSFSGELSYEEYDLDFGEQEDSDSDILSFGVRVKF